MPATMRAYRAIELPSEALETYRRDGAVLIKGLLSSEQLGWIETGLEEMRASPSAMFSRVEAADGRGETLVDQFPSLGSPALRRLLEDGPVAELAARMMGTRSAQLVLDQAFYKQRGHIVPTPWHQDTPFLRVRGHDMARVWLTCDPSPRDVTLEVVRGSHLWNVIYDTAGMAAHEVVMADEGNEFTYSGIGNDRAPLVPDIAANRDSFDILGFDVEPGDAVVFHGNILHGAQGKADHPHARRAFASMWGGPNLRYHQVEGNAMPLPVTPIEVSIPHGAPIGDYPQAFPVYWREG